ncbi:MAG: monovalent cation/H+ antiporter complex subunit F [Pseudomonadota bacterium]
MFTAAIIGVLAALSLAVVRALLGPTAFDRLLAANAIGTFAIMLLALFGFLTGRPEFLDLGITYALLNMIGTLAVLKFFRYGALGYDHREGDREGKG